MTIRDLKERLTETEYVYVAIPNKDVIAEFTDVETAKGYASAFGGVVWDHYPYAEYGFEDPYTFANTWVTISSQGDIIEYNVSEDNAVIEVVVG